MAKVACPVLPSIAVPIVVEPSMNVAEPVGMPAPATLDVTVTVKVTDWPNTDELTDDESAVLVEA